MELAATPEKKAVVNAALHWALRFPNRNTGPAHAPNNFVQPEDSIICPIMRPKLIKNINRHNGQNNLLKKAFRWIWLSPNSRMTTERARDRRSGRYLTLLWVATFSKPSLFLLCNYQSPIIRRPVPEYFHIIDDFLIRLTAFYYPFGLVWRVGLVNGPGDVLNISIGL